MFKVNDRRTRARCEICSKLAIRIPERHHWRRSGIFIVNFWTYLTPCSSVSVVNFEQVNAGWQEIHFNYLFPYWLTSLTTCVFAYVLTYVLYYYNSIYNEMLLWSTTNFSKTAFRILHKFCQGYSLSLFSYKTDKKG